MHQAKPSREPYKPAPQRGELFSSPPLNLFFTNDLVRGNTYQLPVSANKPGGAFIFPTHKQRVSHYINIHFEGDLIQEPENQIGAQ